jgi:hypothetical protein
MPSWVSLTPFMPVRRCGRGHLYWLNIEIRLIYAQAGSSNLWRGSLDTGALDFSNPRIRDRLNCMLKMIRYAGIRCGEYLLCPYYVQQG